MMMMMMILLPWSLLLLPILPRSKFLLDRYSPIAYPTDHKVDDFARNLKQDSQIQAYIASQNPSTMYPVAVATSSSVPPVHPVPTAEPHRRIQPTQVDMVHKSQYFPPRLHPYFHNDDYAPSMPQFERDYLDAYILQRCYVNGKII